MFVNRMPRYEILSEEALATIDRGWRRLISEIGVQFDHPEALERFRAAGQVVEDDVVRLDPEFVLEQVARAPREFAMRARNPEHDLRVGGDGMVFLPAQGPPFVREGAVRRDGTLADLERFIQLAQATPELDSPGSHICEPNDLDLDSRHLYQQLALTTLSDKVFGASPNSREVARDCLAMASILFGGREAIEATPVLFAIVNVNSPLRFDGRMLEALLEYSAAGQVVIVTPFLLMGAMAPVTVPAALVQQLAEALAGVALTQLVRPGAPVILGSFLSNIDMKSGSPGFGGPESALGLLASGQLARHVGLPWRSGGGTLTTSQTVDVQAGYEALNTLHAAFLAGANWVHQSAGWLEGGLVTSYEKFVADVELLQMLRAQFTPLEIDEASLAFDAHDEVRHGGHFLGAAHTMERFRDCFYRPMLASTENFERWTRNGARDGAARAAELWRRRLEEYRRPPMDDALRAELEEYVDRRRIELGDPVPAVAHAATA
jgi:trimethylamine--corrinoid protein Co-methyltransferase